MSRRLPSNRHSITPIDGFLNARKSLKLGDIFEPVVKALELLVAEIWNGYQAFMTSRALPFLLLQFLPN